MKYIITVCLFFVLLSAQSQVITATDMLSLLGKNDTISINQQLNKIGYLGGNMSFDSVSSTKFSGLFFTISNLCNNVKPKEFQVGDALTYEIEIGKKLEYVNFGSTCFDHYKSLVTSFKNAGFSIGNALVPIVPKGKGSYHDTPNEFEFTTINNGFKLSIFIRNQPTGLLYSVLLEPEVK